MKNSELTSKTRIIVRFSETDPMGIVWHGNYIKYLEDAREDFGRKFDLAYRTIYENGLLTPVVKLSLIYKLPLTFGDSAIVEIKYIPSETTKIIFDYRILSFDETATIATAYTEQVFTDTAGNLQLYSPNFYTNWKKKWGLV